MLNGPANANSCDGWISKEFRHYLLTVGFAHSILSQQGINVQGSTP